MNLNSLYGSHSHGGRIMPRIELINSGLLCVFLHGIAFSNVNKHATACVLQPLDMNKARKAKTKVARLCQNRGTPKNRVFPLGVILEPTKQIQQGGLRNAAIQKEGTSTGGLPEPVGCWARIGKVLSEFDTNHLVFEDTFKQQKPLPRPLFKQQNTFCTTPPPPF